MLPTERYYALNVAMPTKECFRYNCTMVVKRFRIDQPRKRTISGILFFRPAQSLRQKPKVL